MWSKLGGAVAALLLVAVFAKSCLSRPDAFGLAIDVDGPALAEAEGLVVFLHGYGGSIGRSDWFVERLRAAGLPPELAIVRIEAPLVVLPSGRAWWKSSLEERAINGGRVERELEALRQAAPRAAGRLYVGGFSQGATMALARAPTVDGVFVLSGCQLTAPARVPKLVYVAHGKKDRICRFEETAQFVRTLEAAGVSVAFSAFDDDHVVPDAVFTELVAHIGAAARP
jgi:predicted esterase